ncbi:MAG: hypothetical protein AAFQ87_21210, partial [Bacteroidota bacterium]
MRKLLLLSLLSIGFWGLSVNVFGQDLQPGLKFSIQRQNNFTYATQWDMRHQWQKDRYSLRLNFHHDNLYNSFRQSDP